MKEDRCPFLEVTTLSSCKAFPRGERIPADRNSPRECRIGSDRDHGARPGPCGNHRAFRQRPDRIPHPRHAWNSFPGETRLRARSGIDDPAQEPLGKGDRVSVPSDGSVARENATGKRQPPPAAATRRGAEPFSGPKGADGLVRIPPSIPMGRPAGEPPRRGGRRNCIHGGDSEDNSRMKSRFILPALHRNPLRPFAVRTRPTEPARPSSSGALLPRGTGRSCTPDREFPAGCTTDPYTLWGVT